MKHPWQMNPTELYRHHQHQVDDITAMLDTAKATTTEQKRKHRDLIVTGGRSAAGDERRLRAIPVHAEGVAGAIPDTRPDHSPIVQ